MSKSKSNIYKSSIEEVMRATDDALSNYAHFSKQGTYDIDWSQEGAKKAFARELISQCYDLEKKKFI